jgi:hypothetical protein
MISVGFKTVSRVLEETEAGSSEKFSWRHHIRSAIHFRITAASMLPP